MVGMVEGHAIGDATAAVMPRDAEALKSEPLHDHHHILRHRPFCVRRMVDTGAGATALAVAAKVGADDGKLSRQQGRDAAPHQMCLRKSMQ